MFPLTDERRPRAAGEEARHHIKEELRRRRTAGEAAPTIDELATATGMSRTTVHHHLKWMESHGQIRIESARREIVLLDGGVS